MSRSHSRWRLFLSGQQRNPRYLQGGDLVEATAATSDLSINLGSQGARVPPGRRRAGAAAGAAVIDHLNRF
jgi:hypothetical protein